MILLARLCDLFLSFARIGLAAFGGGYAMIPLMRAEFIIARQWLTLEEFLDIIAIAEMTPGPVAINSATYIWYKVAGIPGAAAATLGVIAPSVVLILIIAGLFQHFLKRLGFRRINVLAKNQFEIGEPVIATEREVIPKEH